MATGKQLLSDLQHLGNFLNSHKANVSKEKWHGMVQSQLESWRSRLENVKKLSMEEATELAQAVTASPFPEDAKQNLSQVLSEALSRSMQSPKKKNENQDVPHFRNYLSQNDRVVLGDNTKTTLEKIDILVTRCLKIGLHWPTEDAVGHIISAGIAAGLEGGDRKEYYGRVSKFKQVLHKKRAGLTPACTLKNYPDSPMGLPTALQVSYDDDPAVAEVDWAAFQKAEASKTLRKSHLSITGSASSGASVSGLAVMPNAAGTQAFPGMQDPAWQQGLQMMGRMFMPFMNHVAAMQAQGQQQGGSDGINLQFFQQSPGGSSGARAGFTNPSPPEQANLGLQQQQSSLQQQHLPPSQQTQLAAPSTAALQLPQGKPAGESQPEGSNSTFQIPQVEPAEESQELVNDAVAPEEMAKMAAGKTAGKSILKRPASSQTVASASEAKAKPASKAKAKAKGKQKASSFTTAKKGWKVETRFRPDGSHDKYYIAPDKKQFRTRHQAEAYGFSG